MTDTPKSLRARSIDVIGYDSGWGCADHGTEDAPAMLRRDALIPALESLGHSVKWTGPLGLKHLARHEDIRTKEDSLPLVVEGNRRLAGAVRDTLFAGRVPVIIGGDHSCAIGTWAGVTDGLNAHEDFGLIWLDAHMDAHTPETAHQGKWGGWWHGMPIACATGYGHEDLIDIGDEEVKLDPEHISLIGIRSYEPGEEKFLKENNIAAYKIETVKTRGFHAVFKEALVRATEGTTGFGLSIDLDAFDPADAPGTGSPEEDGLRAEDVLASLHGIGSHPLFRALEIVEYNPHNDSDDRKTLTLLEDLIVSVFS